MNAAGSGMLQILRFNWPMYAVAGVAAVAVPLVLHALALPSIVALIVSTGWALMVWWTVASLAASRWIYDRSPLMSWRWIAELLPQPPRRWANIHSGLDQSTQALRALFPTSHGIVFDMFEEATMTEPSIRRARELAPHDAPIRIAPSALPLRDASIDCVFLLFAAHELRDPRSREQLFAEIARVLAPRGHVVIAEHARDLANVAAFGPGAWHFLPSREWPRLAAHAGLSPAAARRITPFVRVRAFVQS